MGTEGKIDDLFSRWAEFGKIGKPRSALECVTAGMQLAMLKVASPHGTFKDRVNVLGLHAGPAARYIVCARKFDPRRDALLLTAIGTTSKLMALLALEDDDIQRLGRGEEARGLTMDSLARMTALQLQRALSDQTTPERVRLTPLEERMVRNFRRCPKAAQALVLQTAEMLAERHAPQVC